MDPHFYWYLARASGIVAFWLLTLSAALGLSVTSRLWDGWLHRPWVNEMHKFISLLAAGFVAIHMLVLLPDPTTRFQPVDLLVPGTSPYRALPVSLGVLAMYGGVVTIGSFSIKRWIGHKMWRLLHFATFGAFALTLLHGLLAGTDSGEPWMRSSYLGAALLVFFLVVYRVLAAPLPRVRLPAS